MQTPTENFDAESVVNQSRYQASRLDTRGPQSRVIDNSIGGHTDGKQKKVRSERTVQVSVPALHDCGY